MRVRPPKSFNRSPMPAVTPSGSSAWACGCSRAMATPFAARPSTANPRRLRTHGRIRPATRSTATPTLNTSRPSSPREASWPTTLPQTPPPSSSPTGTSSPSTSSRCSMCPSSWTVSSRACSAWSTSETAGSGRRKTPPSWLLWEISPPSPCLPSSSAAPRWRSGVEKTNSTSHSTPPIWAPGAGIPPPGRSTGRASSPRSTIGHWTGFPLASKTTLSSFIPTTATECAESSSTW